MRFAIGLMCAWGSVVAQGASPPNIDGLFPAGGLRGTTVRVRVLGNFATWPQHFWTENPDISISPNPDSKGEVEIQIAQHARPGIAWLRSYDAFGASALRPFAIGTMREDAEVEPNDTPVGQPAIPHPHVLINGALSKKGDVDCFLVPLEAGETLVADLQANSFLGSPIDALLQVCSLHEHRGRLEAYVLEQNLDTVGLDPRIAFTAPEAGRYLVRVMAFPSDPGQEIAYTGFAAAVYRLTLTTKGFADYVLPLSRGLGSVTDVKLFGWNIPESQQRLAIPATSEPQTALLSEFVPEIAGFVPMRTGVFKSIGVTSMQAVSLPVAISGRVKGSMQPDLYTIDVKKGETLKFKVSSRSLGFQTALGIGVLDEKQQKSAGSDSRFAARDPELAWTAPADGKYTVQISQPRGVENPRAVYELTISKPQPDFAISVATDRFTLQDDKPLEIPVTIDRQDGYAVEIEVRLEGLPEGVTAPPVVAKGTEKSVKLVLKTNGAVTEGHSVPVRVRGEAKTSPAVAKFGTFKAEIPLAEPQDALWLTVAKQGTVTATAKKKK
ncbi:MAG: hypothetical protein U0903_22510 [Planctomycetales bacterium]